MSGSVKRCSPPKRPGPVPIEFEGGPLFLKAVLGSTRSEVELSKGNNRPGVFTF